MSKRLIRGMVFLVCAVSPLLGVPPAVAITDTRTWENTGTNFNLAANWVDDLPPDNDDIAAFVGAPVSQPQLTASTTVLRLTFDTPGYTLTTSNPNHVLTLTSTQAAVGPGAAGVTTLATTILMQSSSANQTYDFSAFATSSAPRGVIAIGGNLRENNTGTRVRMIKTNTGGGSTGMAIVLSGNNSHSGDLVTSNSGNTAHLNSNYALGTGRSNHSVTGYNLDNSSGIGVTLANAANSIVATTAGLTFTGTNDLTLGSNKVSWTSAATHDFDIRGSSLTVAGFDVTGTGHNFAKSGVGTLVITGTSNYDGVTTLSGGSIIVSDRRSLSSGNIGFNAISFAGSTNLTGSNSMDHTMTLGGNSQLFGTNSVEFSGTVTATGTRTVSNNIEGGTFTISNTLSLAATASNFTLTLNGTGNTVIGGGITNGAATAAIFTYSGLGSLTLRGAGSYGGATTFNNGTITVDAANGGSLPTGTVLNLGGKLIYTGAAGGSSQTIGNLALSAATGSTPATAAQLVVNGGAATTLTIGDTWSRGSSGTINIDLSAGTKVISNPALLNGVVSPSTTGAAYLVTDATGTGFATVSVIEGQNRVVRYTGATPIAADGGGSTLNLIMDVNATSAGTGGAYEGGVLTTNSATGGTGAAYTLELRNTSASGATLTLGKTLNIGGRGLLVTGSNAFTVNSTSGSVALGQSGLELIVFQYSSADFTINAPIGGAASSLTKAGSGHLIVTAANTFTGAVAVSQGSLTIRNSAATGTIAGGVTVSNGAVLQLDGSGGDLAVGAEALQLMGTGVSGNGALRNVAGSNSWGGAITVVGATANGAAPAAIRADTASSLTLGGTITNNSNTVTFNAAGTGAIIANGVISGAGGVNKVGTGNLTFGAANTYTGNTVISGGKLILGASGTIATSPRVVVGDSLSNNAAQLDVTAAGITLAAAQTLTGHGTVVGSVTGAAGAKIHPGNNAVGTLTINNGSLTLAGGTVGLELTSPSSYDRVALTGTGTLDVTGGNLAIADQAGTNVGDIYYIVTNDGVDAVVGNFASFRGVAANLTEGAFFNLAVNGATQWQITYAANFEGSSFTGGNDIAIQVVPEPGMLGVIGLTLAGLLKRRRAR